MIQNTITPAQKKALEDYDKLCALIRKSSATRINLNESELNKEKRVAQLRNNFEDFCEYYLGHYMTEKSTGQITKFGWFHKKAAKTILPDTVTVLEWSREHAKSVFADLFFPLWLYAQGKLDGMVIVSANENKAAKLLGDLQAELENNELWIHDYGDCRSSGSWSDGQFSTSDGIGFWAFGLGQSPRGIREAQLRPNYCVIDDADTKERCRNEQRVDDAINWIKEDLFQAFGLTSGSRFVVAGNRIDKCSIISKMVGDVNPEDPINPAINHIKVYALENPKTHAMDLNGTPAWKERYSRAILEQRWELTGYRAKMREFFHQHVEEGNVFKEEWIIWDKAPSIRNMEAIEIYCDPSFKNTKDSDYKAIVVVGKSSNNKIYILDAWVRQASTRSMVQAFYDFYAWYGNHARYRMESNMLQDLLFDEFNTMGNETGVHLPIRRDDRKKENKEMRIENMSPLFERGIIAFNEDKRKKPDMQLLKSQLLAFPTGHDDAPDALEGALFYLQRAARQSNFTPRQGSYNKNSKRA